MAPNYHLGQHWLIISQVEDSDIHLWTISQEIPQPSIIKTSLKITHLNFHYNFPEANGLNMVLQALKRWKLLGHIQWT